MYLFKAIHIAATNTVPHINPYVRLLKNFVSYDRSGVPNSNPKYINNPMSTAA